MLSNVSRDRTNDFYQGLHDPQPAGVPDRMTLRKAGGHREDFKIVPMRVAGVMKFRVLEHRRIRLKESDYFNQ